MLNRCADCSFQMFDINNSCTCGQGASPYLLIPSCFIDFLFCGWVAECAHYNKVSKDNLDSAAIIPLCINSNSGTRDVSKDFL